MRTLSFRVLAVGALAGSLLAAPAVATASSTSTVGLDLATVTSASPFASGFWSGISDVVVSGNTDAGSLATASGTVTSANVYMNAGGTVRLVVVHPNGGQFQITAVGPAQTVVAGSNTLSAGLPIEAGDVLAVGGGLSGFSRLALANTADVTSRTARDWSVPSVAVGATATPSWTVDALAYGVSGTVTTPTPPVITGMAPASGQAGATVVLTGAHLDGTTAVSFGAVPATFHVDGPGQITAIVPAGATGTSDVTATGPDGTSPAVAVARFTVLAPPPSAPARAPTDPPTAPAPAADAPVPAKARISVARWVRPRSVTVSPDGRSLRVGCALDHGALLTCAVKMMRNGTTVGGGRRTFTTNTPRARVLVPLTGAGRALVRRGGRFTVDVTATVVGRTLSGTRRVAPR